MIENESVKKPENKKNNNMDSGTPTLGSGDAIAFARSRKLVRSPVSSAQQGQQLHEQEEDEQQQQQQQERQQQPQQQLQLQDLWSKVLKTPRVEVAKKMVEELHEFVDKRHNVHKDIKSLIVNLQGVLGMAEKDWKSLLQRAETAERKLLETEAALAALPTTSSAKTSVVIRKSSKVKGNRQTVDSSASITPKRPRASPGDARPGGSKKHKDTPNARLQPANEEVTERHSHTSWQVAGNGRDKRTKNRPVKQKFIKGGHKGEALLVKANGNSYEEVLRAMRTKPELQELGANVQKIRRTRNGEMILELKKDPTASSSSYKELAERAMGGTVEVRALRPEVTLQCKNLDEVTSEEEVRSALKEQCELGEIQMTIRMRRGPFGTQVASIKLPTEAAIKSLKAGKIKVGWSVCTLRVSKLPEVCFKCQEFGHIARHCTGPDRSRLCRRCGEDGHKAQDCRKPPKCLICSNEEGNTHVTGGPRCPASKQATTAKSQWR